MTELAYSAVWNSALNGLYNLCKLPAKEVIPLAKKKAKKAAAKKAAPKKKVAAKKAAPKKAAPKKKAATKKVAKKKKK